MRLVDADKIYPDVMTKREALAISQGQLAYAPTVEAIPKDQYDARLKADITAMLTEIQMEIEELEKPHCHNASHADGCVSKWRVEGVIQQKINVLKGGQEDETV